MISQYLPCIKPEQKKIYQANPSRRKTQTVQDKLRTNYWHFKFSGDVTFIDNLGFLLTNQSCLVKGNSHEMLALRCFSGEQTSPISDELISSIILIKRNQACLIIKVN